MISQGYPLWAVAEDGTAYAVVGWEETPPRIGERWAVLARLGSDPASGTVTTNGERMVFTTTDPTGPSMRGRTERDLRQRMTALADMLERSSNAFTAELSVLIRRELER